MKKVWLGIKSVFSLGVYGFFLIFSSALLIASISYIKDYNQSINHIFQLTDEINLFANVAVKLLDQQLAEEAVIGELLLNTPFHSREELEDWLNQAAACQHENCQEEMTQIWQEYFDFYNLSSLFSWTSSEMAESIEEFCAENPEASGCTELLESELPEEIEELIEDGVTLPPLPTALPPLPTVLPPLPTNLPSPPDPPSFP